MTTVTESPQNFLADLFLDSVETSGAKFSFAAQQEGLDQTFNDILENQFLKNQSLTSDIRPDRIGHRQNAEKRHSALDELKEQADGLGVPLNSVSLGENDMDRLRKVLKDSGLNDEQTEKVMNQLSSGPLTMDRVLAALPKGEKSGRELTLTQESMQYMGIFLQDLGLDANQTKSILSKMKAGQKFGVDTLRSLLQEHGVNLKNSAIIQADPENLKNLLVSMGVQEGDLANFMDKFRKTGGGMSLEGFMSYLKSLERPEVLSAADAQNVRQLMKNLLYSNSLKSNPHFNRIVSLLQSMGDQDINEQFMSHNPAIQALRGGATSAQKVMNGSSGFGDSGNGKGSQSNQSQTGDFSRNMADLGELGSKGASRSGGAKSTAVGLGTRMSESILKQVTDKMVYSAKSNQHRLTLQLTPPNLGRIHINMVLKSHVVQATIVTDNAMVKDALEDNMAQLKDSLNQQGLQLERFDVSTGQEQKQAYFKQNTGRRAKKTNTSASTRKTGESTEEQPKRVILQSIPGRVDQVV